MSIGRVELIEDKQIIIEFRFAPLNEAAESRDSRGTAPSHTA